MKNRIKKLSRLKTAALENSRFAVWYGYGMAGSHSRRFGRRSRLLPECLKGFVGAIRSVDVKAIKLCSRPLERVVRPCALAFFDVRQLLGIILCTRIIPLPTLLREHPEPMLGLFFGLILASAVMIARDAGRPGLRGIIAYLVGGLVGITVVMGVRADTPDAPWFIVVCGAVAICAWILPGVSGSFVLLLLRKYDYIWEALTFHNEMPFTSNLMYVIIPFAIGAVVGLTMFARLLSWVMKRWSQATMMAMTGLLLASLWAIFPFQLRQFETVASGKEKLISSRPFIPSASQLLSAEGLLAIGLAVAGFALVMYIDFRARKKHA